MKIIDILGDLSPQQVEKLLICQGLEAPSSITDVRRLGQGKYLYCSWNRRGDGTERIAEVNIEFGEVAVRIENRTARNEYRFAQYDRKKKILEQNPGVRFALRVD